MKLLCTFLSIQCIQKVFRVDPCRPLLQTLKNVSRPSYCGRVKRYSAVRKCRDSGTISVHLALYSSTLDRNERG